MHFDISQTGAASIRRLGVRSPMQLLVTLIESDPTADRDRLFRKWVHQMIEEDGTPNYVFEADGYIWSVLRYTFTNLLSSLDREKPKRNHPQPKSIDEKIKEKEETQAAVESLKQKIENVVFLNFVLSNGKRLKECTGTECIREGGWFMAIGKQVGKRLVGDVLSEEQVKALRSKK